VPKCEYLEKINGDRELTEPEKRLARISFLAGYLYRIGENIRETLGEEAARDE
jgi:hypothetical protein